jgi:hypothetical protein
VLSAALLLVAAELAKKRLSGSERSLSRHGIADAGAKRRCRSSPQQARPPWTQLRAGGSGLFVPTAPLATRRSLVCTLCSCAPHASRRRAAAAASYDIDTWWIAPDPDNEGLLTFFATGIETDTFRGQSQSFSLSGSTGIPRSASTVRSCSSLACRRRPARALTSRWPTSPLTSKTQGGVQVGLDAPTLLVRGS